MKKSWEFLKNPQIVGSILEKAFKIERAKVCSFSRLFQHLNNKEVEMMEKFLLLDPEEFGVKMELFDISKGTPKRLLDINQRRNGKFLAVQYLPKPVYLAFKIMNKVLEAETGKKLLILSGYRSPAYQAIVFLHNLKKYDFDFLKVVKLVAFPGYSEHHGWPAGKQAIDFVASSNEDLKVFEKTEEFKWLSENAHNFNFYLSYSRNNGSGIRYEPWHWCWRGIAARK
ncbi:M15 family metallopeptidase [Candidatus Azambacteria bacterium]|nr:M15 family metallopeptidase [Candidatus Azambacteria bacterium]